MKILAIDVGGTHVKILTTGHKEVRKIDSGPRMTARQMATAVLKLSKDWQFDVVSIGYPGPVVHGKILVEPRNLGGGWVRFDFAKAFRRPVKLINDAAMQALGSYEGGKMLFLGLGTGLGTAVVDNGMVEAMEIAHLLYKKGKTFEDYLGLRGLQRLGKKRWREVVFDVVGKLSQALEADYVVLGGGNAKKLKRLPRKARMGDNANAFLGGYRLWKEEAAARNRRRKTRQRRATAPRSAQSS